MSRASPEHRITPVFLPFILELPVIQVLTPTPKSAILPCSRVQRHSHPPPDPLIFHADLSHTHPHEPSP